MRFSAVEGTKVTFSFSGSFALYDGEGGRTPSEVNASGTGVAHSVITDGVTREGVARLRNARSERGISLAETEHK